MKEVINDLIYSVLVIIGGAYKPNIPIKFIVAFSILGVSLILFLVKSTVQYNSLSTRLIEIDLSGKNEKDIAKLESNLFNVKFWAIISYYIMIVSGVLTIAYGFILAFHKLF